MKSFYCGLAVFALLLVGFTQPAHADENGGTDCAVCTLVVGLIDQNAQINNRTIQGELDYVCSWLGKDLQGICDFLVNVAGPILIPIIESGGTADTGCHALGLCKVQTATCALFPPPKNMKAATLTDHFLEAKALMESRVRPELRAFNICTILPEVCQMENHLPAFDLDGDRFSTTESLRGSYWRGKDCDDFNGTIYPGRDSHDVLGDYNCNGIYGTNPTTGNSYEDDWCAGTGARGIAVLGDSATAHFRLPADYVTGATFEGKTYKNALRLIENEADWPMLSWGTGHLNTSQFAPDVNGPMDSLYKRLFERNRCNHRDYQNLGVNGAAVGKLKEWVELLARSGDGSKGLVKPIVAFFSMIGNDVCSHTHDFERMTKPDVYYAAVMDALYAADAKLPNGSHVVLVPLVDGRILYDEMHARIHPIGKTNNDVTYEALYDFLNCLHISPCWGWMNSNETVRNTTWEHAQGMNAQLDVIISNTSLVWRNIKVHYPGNVIDHALNHATFPKWELIEPVDGFHPSQRGNALIAEVYWNMTQHLGIWGETNPNNAAIEAQFGDQGGY